LLVGGTQKVAVLIPYLGEALPSWFDLFALTAQKSQDIFDWYILVTEAQTRKTPINVKLIQISRDLLYKRLSLLDPDWLNSTTTSSNLLMDMFRALIDKHPYVLVEFKPCLGFIFPDIVEGYSHWAYADMDMLAGRVDSFVSLQHIHTFDIITLSFGDNNRLYMRGQMTINRNSEHVRNLWARCNHLSKIGARLSAFYNDGPDKGKWYFQSAEGCYSRAVMDDTRVRVLILSTQVTDAYRADLLDKESFMIGGAILKCYQEPLNTSNVAAFEGFLTPRYSVTIWIAVFFSIIMVFVFQ
jgi:hypothetical protein